MTAASPAPWAVDRSGAASAGPPAEHVVARDVEEVSAVLARAHATGTPVVTRGAGSGLAGGAVAGPGSIVLDLSRLDRILEIDTVEQWARVEPGVVTADLDRAAREDGLFFAPDPGSSAISTVGGNIATNAGGLRGAKYGVTRDAVLSLDVVLADGTRVTLGRPTLKGVAGYDLTSLVVGSEGTLGVVVGATVRLLPVPVAVATASVYFASLEDAAAALSTIGATGVRPSVLEFLDGETLARIDEAEGTDLAIRGDAFLLVQTDGVGAEAELTRVLDALGNATRIERAADAAEAERLLAVRRAALPALERLGRVLIEDIAVPRRRLVAAVTGIRAIAAKTGTRIFVFGHAGDGNLHPIVLVGGDPADPIPENAERAATAIFELALELGGTIAAEHGIGSLKRAWLPAELGERVSALQHAVKAAFDPTGILNPGKAI